MQHMLLWFFFIYNSPDKSTCDYGDADARI